ncbi:hypothetical protein GWN63_02470, partial [Candidatus Bathyarchaeota archaeon]|nr:nucleotidyltransferase domain-containing protein [Candidatus Bathyarchaeota archaeon]NIR14498.1 nucleotidyltransferase domain-containing protein [Desulfobacterales bacterium]NIU81095.1 hypothetical protein [Candidatus Bathyarchaeota archaeon]NIV67733.1 hypothetical protein [Candidatus Bathyarchaeota archaeon]NIW34338.1 hypothetical protein [Candidatus Bathyarchaeota archaeon]
MDPETTCSPSWAKAFEKNGVKLAYLFGSRARATSRESSDYDFAVLLDRDVTVEPQVGLTLDLADAFGVSVDKVDVVLLDEAELELVYRVLKEGRLVYKSGEDVRRRWERKALIKTLESKDLYHIYMKRIRT